MKHSIVIIQVIALLIGATLYKYSGSTSLLPLWGFLTFTLVFVLHALYIRKKKGSPTFRAFNVGKSLLAFFFIEGAIRHWESMMFHGKALYCVLVFLIIVWSLIPVSVRASGT